jgi:hypothetical protein
MTKSLESLEGKIKKGPIFLGFNIGQNSQIISGDCVIPEAIVLPFPLEYITGLN